MKYIAIAEDNSFLVKSLAEKISFFDNLELKHSSENGKELLENLKKDANIDIILMDIQMPEMDGIEATKIIKKKYPKIKIVMLTVYDDDKSIFDSIMAGANGYLLKEINPKSLYKYIMDVLSGGAPMSSRIASKTLDLLRNPNVQNSNINSDLSKRQIEILELISKGYNYKEIAKNLFIAPSTVRKHIENIYKILRVHSKIEAIQEAKNKGYIR